MRMLETDIDKIDEKKMRILGKSKKLRKAIRRGRHRDRKLRELSSRVIELMK